MWTRSHHLLRTGGVGKTTACQPSAITQTAAAPRQSGARMLFLHKPHSTYIQATARYCKLCHHTSWPPSLSMLGHARHRLSSCSSLVLKTSCTNSNRRVIVTSAGIHHMCVSSTLGKSRTSSATSHGLSSSSWRTTTGSLSTLQSVSNSRSASNNSSSSLPAVDQISSAANPYIKHCVKLRQSTKYRQQQRRVLLVGETLLAELAGNQILLAACICCKSRTAMVMCHLFKALMCSDISTPEACQKLLQYLSLWLLYNTLMRD